MSSAERLQSLVPAELWRARATRDGLASFESTRSNYHECMRRLKDAGFETCTLLTAIDHAERQARFELVVQLLSLEHNERVRVFIPLTESAASVATITDLWPGAAYFERECYDMFGILFDGHANLKRLLMPEGYDHHPLRKDFPHQGIEPDRLYRAWDRARNASRP